MSNPPPPPFLVSARNITLDDIVTPSDPTISVRCDFRSDPYDKISKVSVRCCDEPRQVRVLRVHEAADVRSGRSAGALLLVAQGGRDDRRQELPVQAPGVHQAAELRARGRARKVLLGAQAGRHGERRQPAVRVSGLQATGVCCMCVSVCKRGDGVYVMDTLRGPSKGNDYDISDTR